VIGEIGSSLPEDGMEKDYRLVPVGGTPVGLIGLKEIFEELKSQKGKPEPLLKEMLVEKARENNYIPSSAGEEYAKALLREFKNFLGERVEEERREFLEIAILGPGCYSCNKLEQDVMAVLSETGIKANLNHITDIKLMVQCGIVITPALAINGRVKSKGTLPPKSTIKKWLEEERG
jgi:small redox-active disulfide protein 2